MGRTPRANLPGVPFHLISRVQGRDALLVGLEQRVIDIVQDSVLAARLRLLAYAVMPNHLHLVLVQGASPLARCMQPMLRRLALLVMKTTMREGHVFERRYRDRACLDALYLRNVIAYVHLNPVRAKLCISPVEYRWTSHLEYCKPKASGPIDSMLESGLQLFADKPAGTRKQWTKSYLEFLRWRVAFDRELEAEEDGTPASMPKRPWNADGDAHWCRMFGDSTDAAHAALTCSPDAAVRPDLRVIAENVLKTSEPRMELTTLRSGDRTLPLVRVRRLVIERSLLAGYAPHQIARFLNVSPTTVSRVSARHRIISG